MKIWVNQVINKMISFFFFLVWKNLHLHCIHFVQFMNIVLCNSLYNTHSHNSQPQISSFAVVHLVMLLFQITLWFGLYFGQQLIFSLSSFMIVITTDNITNNNDKNNNFRPKFLGCLHCTFQCFQNIILF